MYGGLMQILINIDVDDLGRAIEFYRMAFNLELSRRLFDGRVAELRGASSTIYLLTKPEGTAPWQGATSARDYQRHWTPVHLDFVVPDIARGVERAVAAGARLESEARSFPWGWIAMLSDPFGHGFCLLQFSDAGYDVVAEAGGA
jgi:predicted enzyme related to lactoylglutathione lyase